MDQPSWSPPPGDVPSGDPAAAGARWAPPEGAGPPSSWPSWDQGPQSAPEPPPDPGAGGPGATTGLIVSVIVLVVLAASIGGIVFLGRAGSGSSAEAEDASATSQPSTTPGVARVATTTEPGDGPPSDPGDPAPTTTAPPPATTQVERVDPGALLPDVSRDEFVEFLSDFYNREKSVCYVDKIFAWFDQPAINRIYHQTRRSDLTTAEREIVESFAFDCFGPGG